MRNTIQDELELVKKRLRMILLQVCIFQKGFLKDYIEDRALEIADYIIEHKAMMRQTAKRFGVSKNTIHMVVTI